MFIHPVLMAARGSVTRAGGAEEVAKHLVNAKTGKAKSHETLTKELDPNVDSAKFGLLDAVAVAQVTGDLSILEAFAAALGCKVTPLAQRSDEKDVPFVQRLCTFGSEFGDVMREAGCAAADGVVTDNELSRLEKEWDDVVAEGREMIAHARRLNAEAKPAYLRVAA